MSTEETIAAETAGTPDQPKPVSATGGRISSLDFIRGLAVMGILLANIVAFGQPFSAYMWPDAFIGGDGDPGGWMWIAQFVLIDSKMRGLFTLLFGAGMILFVEKAWEKGATRWLQARRLCWLFMFGMLHFFLLWRGDILTLYAVCGLIALLCVNWQPKTMIVVGVTVYSLFSLLYAAFFGFMRAVMETPFGASPEMAETKVGFAEMKTVPLADDKVEVALKTDGSWFEMVAHRFTEHGLDWIGFVVQVGWETVPLMLIGMALFRLGMFDGRMNPAKQRLWGWIGVIVGAVLTLIIALWVRETGFTYFGTLFAFIGASMLVRLPMILGMAALLALWGPKATGWLGERVVAAGRMAFSNYIGTSVVMLFVFSGWALGLFGQLNRPQLYLVVIATWVLMLLWSKPWLETFRYGPLEWLWRCLTYGKMFPLKR